MTNTMQILAAFREMLANKNISRDELHDLIKDGIMAALARRYGPTVEAEVELDEAAGTIKITVLKEVVEEVEDSARQASLEEARWDDPDFEPGDVLEIPVEFADFGRNAVMAAKQRMIQRVREGERNRIREEYNNKVGDLLSAEVQQVERGKIVIMLNKTRDADAIIPWKEQNPRERFRQGEPIRAVLKRLEETPKGPRLILSRADPLFVAALFKLEVPEIYQGIVDIKGIAREVGGRTKLAVTSRDESIDPVGACVGLKGSRVQAVVSELGGERIDIVPWHPDPEVYGSREWLERGADEALFGAAEQEYEVADFPVKELDLPIGTLVALEGAGYTTFFDIIDLEREDLLRIPGFTEEDADSVLRVIDELTVEDAPSEEPAVPGPTDAEMAEVQEVAAEILALPMSEKKKKTTTRSDAGE